MLDQNRLDKEMHTFHSEKLVETFDAVTAGRITKRRRRTRAREFSLSELLTAFENHNEELQIQNLHFHLLELGTNASPKLDATYFDHVPPLTELNELSEPVTFLSEKSFLDDSLPDLEPIPIMTEIPSFIGQEYENRDCNRVCTRSRSARFTPISDC